MTTTVLTATTATVRRPLLRAGVVAGLAAAIATPGIAAVGRRAGISLDIAGEPIPLYAFAQLTLIGALLGVGVATLCRRTSAPRIRFVQGTVALTAASFVPDLLVDAAVSTRVLLMATHVAAAAIVIPVLARRLP